MDSVLENGLKIEYAHVHAQYLEMVDQTRSLAIRIDEARERMNAAARILSAAKVSQPPELLAEADGIQADYDQKLADLQRLLAEADHLKQQFSDLQKREQHLFDQIQSLQK